MAQTIQQEHIFSEESEISENLINSSSSSSSSARVVSNANEIKKNSMHSREFDADSEEIISDSNYKIIPQKDSCVKTHSDKEITKVNERNPSDSKLSSVDVISKSNLTLEEITKTVHEFSYKSKVLNSRTIASVNSLKNANVNEKKEKDNHKNLVIENRKEIELDLIQIFEKKMDYENYFPHNNSENIIRLYNKSMDLNPMHLTKKNRRNLGRRSKLNKLPSPNLKKNFEFSSMAYIDLKDSVSCKKIPHNPRPSFFHKYDEIFHKNNSNLDRKAIIKLLNSKKKKRNINIFVRLIRCLFNMMKED